MSYLLKYLPLGLGILGSTEKRREVLTTGEMSVQHI